MACKVVPFQAYSSTLYGCSCCARTYRRRDLAEYHVLAHSQEEVEGEIAALGVSEVITEQEGTDRVVDSSHTTEREWTESDDAGDADVDTGVTGVRTKRGEQLLADRARNPTDPKRPRDAWADRDD